MRGTEISDTPLNVEGLNLTVKIIREMRGLQPQYTLVGSLNPVQTFSQAFVNLLPTREWTTVSTSKESAEIHLRALVVRDMVVSGIEPGEAFQSYAPEYMTSGQIRIISNVPSSMLEYIERFYEPSYGFWSRGSDEGYYPGSVPRCVSVSQYEDAKGVYLAGHPFEHSRNRLLQNEGFALIMGALEAEVIKAKTDGVQLLMFIGCKLPHEWQLKVEA
jgi:hypothetical protein